MSLTLDLDRLLQLENRALAAPDLAALRFTITNETHALVYYRQAVLFEPVASQLKIVAASGLVSVAEDAPFTVWLTQFVRRLPLDHHVLRLDHADASESDQVGWAEWLPEHLLFVPLKDRQDRLLALAVYARETEWADADVALLERLHALYGHCYLSLAAAQASVWKRIFSVWNLGKSLLLLTVLSLILWIPVRMSVLAPAEVIALNAVSVTAPQDGVIGSFSANPNSKVRQGDVLFSLDDTVLQSRRDVARKALEVARVDAHVAQQRAFDDMKGRAELATLLGRVREKEAELAAVEALTDRIEIRAEHDGIAIFSDVNDWLGRPVQTGERVLQLAQPEDAGLLIWLAVADAINLEQGASVQFFLHTDPLQPRKGALIEASYQSTLSPQDVAAYRLKARFDEGTALPRIGLRGTARLSGEKVSLGYYLFRRPLAAVREWTGL